MAIWSNRNDVENVRVQVTIGHEVQMRHGVTNISSMYIANIVYVDIIFVTPCLVCTKVNVGEP